MSRGVNKVILVGNLGEIAGEYLKKGRQVYIEGSLRTNKYTDKEGVERYTTDIVANEMQMLGGSGGGEERQQARTQRSEQRSASQEARRDSGGALDSDEIPFLAPITRRNWGALS